MCIVVDINCLPAVLNKKHATHAEFKSVSDWILTGKGKLVYGGSKYKEELKRARRYLRLVLTLGKKKKTVTVPDREVDHKQDEIDKSFVHSRFNDSHLVAIIVVSKCRLLCSADSEALPFLKKKQFYARNVNRPKIYSSRKNADLLRDKNIADICKPCKKANKSLMSELGL